MIGILRPIRFCRVNSLRLSRHVLSVRKFGGYIEDAQLTQFGLEIYQEKYGLSALPPVEFVIPLDDESWPYNLWGYSLGKGVFEHISTKNLNPIPTITPSSS